MSRLVAIFLFGLGILLAGSAAAQQAWIQVQARPTLAEGSDRAATYAATFPDVAGYRLSSGWYGIVLGPYAPDEAAQRLAAMRAQGLIPADSFVTDGARFVDRFWPAGIAADPAPAEPTPAAGAETTASAATEAPAGQAAAAGTPGQIPDETPAEARRSEAALSYDERAELQSALQWEGHYSGKIDGAFGSGTRSAMADWQAMKGYETTGVLTSRQRAELVGTYRQLLSSLGMQTERDNTAGIEMRLPMALVAHGAYQSPFAHYDSRDGSGVQVILISQEGDKDTLFGLYDILQTLKLMPLDGPRSRDDKGFSIDGVSSEIVSHAEARLTAAGNIKGFILVWPAGDEKRRLLALQEMSQSFTPLEDSVLPASAGGEQGQSIDLVSGLEIRKPERLRSGFFVSADGAVLTTSEAVAGCTRVTLDDEVQARVAASDAATGLALLRADAPLAPLAVASFRQGPGRLQSEVAVSGYSYDGALGASVLTFGRLADLKGLAGETGINRLSMEVTPSDAGGPVFDGAGAVMAMLLPAAQGSKVLPPDANFAVDAATIAGFLTGAGMTPALAEPAGDIPAETLTRSARDLTVKVSCWN